MKLFDSLPSLSFYIVTESSTPSLPLKHDIIDGYTMFISKVTVQKLQPCGFAWKTTYLKVNELLYCGHRALIRLSLNKNTFPLRITCVPLKMKPKRKIKLFFVQFFCSFSYQSCFKSIKLTRQCQERSNYFLLKPEMRKFCSGSKKLIGLWNFVIHQSFCFFSRFLHCGIHIMIWIDFDIIFWNI